MKIALFIFSMRDFKIHQTGAYTSEIGNTIAKRNAWAVWRAGLINWNSSVLATTTAKWRKYESRLRRNCTESPERRNTRRNKYLSQKNINNLTYGLVK